MLDQKIMKFLSKAEHFCAVALIIFFFFPWISIVEIINIAGYQIPDIARGFGEFAAFVNEDGRIDSRVFLFYLVYLIPILSVVTIIFGMTDKDTKVIGFLAGIVPIACFIYTLAQFGTDILQGMGIGAYLTLISAIAMIFAVSGPILGFGILFLVAGIGGSIYGVTTSLSFLLVAGIIYLLLTGTGLCRLRHWAWLTALCGFSATLLFSLLGVIQGSVAVWIAFAVWIVVGAIIWYFTGTGMKHAFGITSKDVKFLFLLPAATWVLLFTVFPFLYGVRTSFYKVQIGRGDKFVWFKNFVRFFKDYKIHNSIKITLIFIVVTVVTEIVLGLLIALFLTRK